MGEASDDASQNRLLAAVSAAQMEKVYNQFPADIRVAFEAAEQLRRNLAGDLAPVDEPWPAMRTDASQ